MSSFADSTRSNPIVAHDVAEAQQNERMWRGLFVVVGATAIMTSYIATVNGIDRRHAQRQAVEAIELASQCVDRYDDAIAAAVAERDAAIADRDMAYRSVAVEDGIWRAMRMIEHGHQIACFSLEGQSICIRDSLR